MAQADLAFATLSSPINGTVAAVALTAGSAVTAGSSDAVVTILGDDGYVVSSTVTLSNIGKLKIGQTATATLPSSGSTVTGSVSSIGVVDTATDSSTPSYDITIALDDDQALLNGASASVSVAVAVGDSVLTIPTSAAHRSGTDYTVDVVRDGTASSAPVEVGAIGDELTEITSGLTEGDQVVLADLSEAIPTDDSSTSSGLSGLGSSTTNGGGPSGAGGTFPGGSGPSGGAPGAR
ncbi:hypothetical protein GCM10010988_40010 [Cnuibacter physcomitrellae]|uniref:YknX-like C-terminal permuted SH3-like domain-containing protein n=1 Tax=Cnuibacter physcomitrellae TaxID=1619308 RepID=A0A1X9LR46_9MICO|nr:efflux RND transporter periplasmic adaptor subunit [Cnuibacter physcomitrellae]ARJ07674.1 hypothetical protein B5808_20065 [Cnuibacter physcomitrellae]GGI42632.1 hypothetical protein GCM10010988_40010 [Cnuibacter physcomitrellae]